MSGRLHRTVAAVAAAFALTMGAAPSWSNDDFDDPANEYRLYIDDLPLK